MSECERYRELIGAELDGEATEAERAALSAHLETCEDCRRYRDALRAVSGALREDLAEPPETLTFAVMSKLELNEKLRRQREQPKRFTPWRMAGLAASLLIIAGLGLAIGHSQGGAAAAQPRAAYAVTADAAASDASAGSVSEEQTESAAAGDADTSVAGEGSVMFSAAAAPAPETGQPAADAADGEASGTTLNNSNGWDPITAAAQAYVEENLSDQLSAITDFDAPQVEELNAQSVPANFISCAETYDRTGTQYMVTFSTADDGPLGPITLLVDENGVVYGMLPRE